MLHFIVHILQEENIHATAGRVFIIPNKLQVLKIFCKELWIQRLKTVSKIYHFVSLHQQSIGIVFCWADDHELVEGLFCDGLLYKAASKIIFSLIFIQQQRFDFNHLLQKTCSDRCMIWNIAGNSVEMIKVKFCCHLTWPANGKIWLCMSIARSLGKILFGFEHGKHDLFKASQGHHHFTQFWNLKFNYQKEKRVYLCYLFSYFVDVHILWLERVLRGWENFRYIRAAIETAEDFVGYLSDHAWKKDEKLSYVCKRVRECWAKLEHLSN